MILMWFILVFLAFHCFAIDRRAGKSPCHWDAFRKKTICHSDEPSVNTPAHHKHLGQNWPEGNLIPHLGDSASIVADRSSHAPKGQEGIGAISKHMTVSAEQHYKKILKSHGSAGDYSETPVQSRTNEELQQGPASASTSRATKRQAGLVLGKANSVPVPPPPVTVSSSQQLHGRVGPNEGWNLPQLEPARAKCSVAAGCEGVNLMSFIRRDLSPWANSTGYGSAAGSITRADVDAAMSWNVLKDKHTMEAVKGWIRLTIVNGELFATNLGAGFGTRDALFVLMLMELIQRFGLPDVDFVLYTEDRARLAREAYPRRKGARGALPFALGFARHDEFLDVGVPDSSFWGWPELGLLPHWLLAHSADAQIAWSSKAKQVHWRGGLKRSGRLREAMVACAQRLSKSQPLQPQPAQPQPAHPQPAQQPLQPSHQDQQVLGPNDEDIWRYDISGHRFVGGGGWESPLAMSKSKLALFIQGEGYTSSKQRVLASGSCPVFTELTGHDTYYGRFLRENVHYKRVAVLNESQQQCGHPPGACVNCPDLAAHVNWAAQHDNDAAAACGARAKAFSGALLSRRMLLDYLRTVLVEVSLLQHHDLHAVVAQVHAPKGNGKPLTPANALSILRHTFRAISKANSHHPNGKAAPSADKASASAALALAFWWLELRTQTFELMPAQMSADNATTTIRAFELAGSGAHPHSSSEISNGSTATTISSNVEDLASSSNGWCRRDLCRSCCTLEEHRRKDPK